MDLEKALEELRRKLTEPIDAEPVSDEPDPVIGFLCHHGHFQFINDDDFWACGSKRIGVVRVEQDPDTYNHMYLEALERAIERLKEFVLIHVDDLPSGD